jgi:formylglycine-generating enzyme required for sulfatase activity
MNDLGFRVALRPGVKSPVTPPPPPPPTAALRILRNPTVTLEQGQTKTVTVRVERVNCPGPIPVQLDRLPDGVQAGPATIPADADSVRVTLTAADDAEPGERQATLTVSAGDARTEGALAVRVIFAKEITNSTGMKLVLIPAGKFTNGRQREVAVPRPYYAAVHAVTVGQFRAFVKDTNYKTDAERTGKGGGWNDKAGSLERPKRGYSWRNPGFDQADDHPVVNVSWNDAVKFCEWLSKKEGKRYELPTETEWEYACRAGTTTRFWTGDDLASLKGAANLADPSLQAKRPPDYKGLPNTPWDDGFAFTAPVGSFKANPWGLYDTYGNVWQWTADAADVKQLNRLLELMTVDAPEEGQVYCLKGVSFDDSIVNCETATRSYAAADFAYATVGFRVVRRLGMKAP